ncbi:MAG: AAA family ATPase [Lachnospiraceae bacterium]|nr:AAA family ATPase [Lachnospiraceae bacterium]
MEYITTKKDFIHKVHGVIDDLGGKVEFAPDPIRYRVTFLNRIINLMDAGSEGIKISLTYGESQITADPVYNWLDAYNIVYLLTVYDPASGAGEMVFYESKDGNGVKRLHSLKTLGKKPIEFEWIPKNRLYDCSDEYLLTALNLVKCGAIKDIKLVEQDGQTWVSITGERAVCADAELSVFANEGKNGTFPSPYFSGAYAAGNSHTLLAFQYGSPMDTCGNPSCNSERCLFGLCGYLEYLYRNGEIYPFFLDRKNYKIRNGAFDFTWRPENGLRKISEPTFYAANMLVDLGQVVVDESLRPDYRIQCYKSVNINGTGVTLLDLVAHINSYKDNPVSRDYTVDIEKEIATDYEGDLYCVFTTAAYIYYLKKTGQENLIRSDREYFAAHNRDIKKEKQCDFDISENCFQNISKDQWDLAARLQRECYVSLCPLKDNEKNTISICSNGYLYDHINDPRALMKLLEKGMISRLKDRDLQDYDLTYKPGLNLEDVFVAEGWPVVIALAAFIDYVDMKGGLGPFEEKLRKKWEEERAQTQKTLEALDDDIVDKLVVNPDCDSLYCVIQGEDGTGRKQKAIAIANKLLEVGKIDHFEPIDDIISFEMASYKLQHYSVPHEYDISEKVQKSGDGEPLSMENVRSTLFVRGLGFYENNRDYVTEKVTFKKNRIYILTNLRDFLPGCEDAKIGDNGRVSHLIECLGRYSRQTYIILIDEQKYIDHLFSLFPQVKYLFGSTIISTESLKEQEIFEIYKKNLQTELRESISSDDSYQKDFIDFCTQNRKKLAMKNRELAEFLANYSNIHHDPRRMFEAMEIYSSKSTDELLEGVIGMDNVKKRVGEFKQYAIYRKYADNIGMKIPNSNLHMLFTGNPGTGKTMIARIIGQILYDAGIIEENKVIEVEGKDLKGRYIGESGPKTAAKIDEAIGGVLFVDEAYAIGDDVFGKEVVATLIKSMEDRKDKFVVIFAGYPKEMQEFLNINSGINSRIGYKFHFDDYSDTELLQIFNTKMTRAGYKYSNPEAVEKLVLKLCQTFSRKKDFGNGRFIDRVIQQTVIGRATRDYKTDPVNIITPEDIPTEEELLTSNVIKHESYEKQLDAIIGMENVKKKIAEFANFVKFKQKVEDADPHAKIPDSNMHMIFTGNPGTGKTTVARIMVDLLYEVGMIRERKYIEVERKDLVGEHIGKTALKTGEVIERALNGVLFIDEAYSLAPGDSGNDFGAEAIATLIKAMEDHKGDLVVIFAGYRDEMRRFEQINPGISSRIGYRFDFEDYTCDELVDMFSNRVTASGFTIDADALSRVKTVSDYYRRKKNFGNGRFIARLWQDTLTKHSSNYDEDTLMKITEADIPTVAEMNNTSIKKSNNASLDGFVGLKEVKAQMELFEKWVKFTVDAREKGLRIPAASLHMVFSGNPGTGKTTVARVVAQKLYDLGIIMENKVVEADRSTLVSNHVGETALKTHDVIESAMGGVLFIDEAYMLAEEGSTNNFGAEAVNTLMKVMEDKKEDFVVIFAGYKKEMKDFLNINPGIESRIGYTFNFEDYDASELLEIFVRKMDEYEFIVDEKAKEAALKVFKYFSHVPNFGNGRFVDKVIRQTLMKQANGYAFDTMNYISEDIIPTIEEMTATMGDSERFVLPDSLTEQDKERVAVHEMGHAAVHCIIRPDIPIIKVTIEPEGDGSLGYVEYGERKNTLATKSDYLNEIITVLAGLEAETVFYGENSAGGSSDLSRAKEIAAKMINNLGMGEQSFGIGDNDIMSSMEINSVISECRDNAHGIIEDNKGKIEELVNILKEKECLDGNFVMKAFNAGESV